MQNLIERLEEIESRPELKQVMKKFIMGILYGRISDEEIDFLQKIKNVLNKVKDNNTQMGHHFANEDLNHDNVTFIMLINDIYKLAIDMEIEK